LYSGLHVRHVVELENVGVLCRSDDPDPVTEEVFLQELLGEVLDITLGEGDVRGDGQLVTCKMRSKQ
jgi:hypothetical protein